MMLHEAKIAQELAVSTKQVIAVIGLLDDGATIPFIARYRKELTGSLDEVMVATIRDRVIQLRELDKRRETILKTLGELQVLTPYLEQALESAQSITQLEDIYLPYRPKRKTRASVAKEKGLAPLAVFLWKQEKGAIQAEAEKHINRDKAVSSAEEAMAGARDILAEEIAENGEARAKMRHLFEEKGIYVSSVVAGKEEEGIKYTDYFAWQEPIKSAASHRVLAMRRGEKEGVLRLVIQIPEEEAVLLLTEQFVLNQTKAATEVALAVRDGFKRLLFPAMETERRLFSRQKADQEAVAVFSENVKQLLLAAPLGRKRVMALDPGFRTGCKVVCLDQQGSLLENTTIYPHHTAAKAKEAADSIKTLHEKYQIEAVAIGNGTAGRETEEFIRKLALPGLLMMVNESGASVYSASEVARNEFPTQDITVRGAISIGRRLMDPLAELVKIDPKSIGVGQYQHDVDQVKLQASLGDVVISCVNAVGVELNTASKELLTYVSGLGPVLAQNIINYREEHGAFKCRVDLKKVPRLGEKAYEQAAGFLRISGAENPLDASAVHPERYGLVEQIAKDLKTTIPDLLKEEAIRKQVKLQQYVSNEVGLPTLRDILNELAKPGRDPRQEFEAFSFTEGINHVTDVKPGMKLPGIVTNITNFGAFVDIGVHQDGLVHLSQLSNRFVKEAQEVVKVQQRVFVTVLEVDEKRERISLSMKTEEDNQKKPMHGAKKHSVRVQRPEENKEKKDDMQAKLAALKERFN